MPFLNKIICASKVVFQRSFFSATCFTSILLLSVGTYGAHAQQGDPYPSAPKANSTTSEINNYPVNDPQEPAPQPQRSDQYSMQEIIDSGNDFFGSTSGGLAKAVETIFKRYGTPNGYIRGQEASGAFILGVTYGEGTLYTKNAGNHKLYWQGPSVGFDAGGNGSQVMVLAYRLRDLNKMFGRYGGMSGSAYFVAGVSFNVLSRDDVLLVPIRTGVGARLGININYLKLSAKPTWNPF